MSKECTYVETIDKLHKTIYNQDQKISDLEAKIAVADDCADRYWKQLGVLEEVNKELEAKLAECEKLNEYFADRVEKADKEIKEIYKEYNKLVEEYNNLKEEVDNNFVDGQDYNQLKQQLAEFNTKIVEEMELSSERRKIIEDLTIENRKLEQQLAEKEKEIETLKEENERNKAEAESQHKSFIDCFKDKMGLTLYYDNIEKQHNQDKISFAVEQLEKVKEYIKTNLMSFQKVPIIQEINNQIKQLKEKQL